MTLDVGERFPVEKLPHPLDGPAVVYFYPADFTRGCTIEAQRFNDIYDDFRAAGGSKSIWSAVGSSMKRTISIRRRIKSRS